jgi:hypothetical protein
MAQQSDHLVNPVRGPSRFRLAIKPRSDPPRPYAWEIHDDERSGEEPVRQSTGRFRTFKEAWAAGTIALEKMRDRSIPSPSPTPDDQVEPHGADA